VINFTAYEGRASCYYRPVEIRYRRFETTGTTRQLQLATKQREESDREADARLRDDAEIDSVDSNLICG
jgi:hypothetical protein